MSIGGGGGQLEVEEEKVEDWKVFEVTVFDHHYVEMRVDDHSLTFIVRNLRDSVLDTLLLTNQ